ncbi:hypothetical protein MTO96_014937 [Rhipicephalus appendiculatus]
MQVLEDRAVTTLPYHITSAVRPGSVESFPDATDVGLTEAKLMAILRKLDASLTEVTLVTTNIRYVNSLLNLWRSNDSDLFHALVSWFTVQVAALFANRELIYNYYDDKYNLGHVYYGVFCASRAMFFSRRALFARYNADVLHDKANTIARELTLSVRTAFRRRLSNWAHFDENITVVANWSSLSMVFANLEERSEENETRIQGQLPDMTDSFLKNWQHSVLVRNEPEVEDMLHSMLHLSYYVISYGKRDFQLMPYALSFPLFDAMLPSSVNYGGFGLEITQALSDLLLGLYEASVVPHNMSLAECLTASQFGDVFDPPILRIANSWSQRPRGRLRRQRPGLGQRCARTGEVPRVAAVVHRYVLLSMCRQHRRGRWGGDPTSKRVGREAAHSESAFAGSRESARTSRNNGFQDV